MGLICPIHPFWVVAKCAAATATPVAIDLDHTKVIILDWFGDHSPTLKGLSSAVLIFLGSIFYFSFDFW
jgi:hypothetical protein